VEKVAFLLGSNLNSRQSIINKAILMMQETIGKVFSISKPYETPPWGYESSNPFINQAIVLTTSLTPENVLKQINEIETVLGRKRNSDGYEDRTIDIDIELWENKNYTTSEIEIPHKHILDRQFVLIPLNEIIPNWIIDFGDTRLTTVKDALKLLQEKEGQIEIKKL